MKTLQFFSFQFKLQFDDSLTETFEYPSETSLMVDESIGDEDEVDASFYGRSAATNSTSKLMNSVPLGKWNQRRKLQWIWCYMCFRFDAIRKLSAAKGERHGFWAWYYTHNAITVVGIEWRKHIHIESGVGRWRLFKTSDGRRKQAVEQRRNARDRLTVLRAEKYSLHLKIIVFLYEKLAYKFSVQVLVWKQNWLKVAHKFP